ncbi:ADP-ribosyltransferase [Bacillus cereus]|uniref:ADP-ribosyltransferase n=2 Tax=Bacillus cereus group TaxID=86661 RepID=A0AB34D488_BACCE|nr:MULTISPECIES: ADP-ribosyltransferase [Bacillus cereus group]KAB2496899.1 ADP-ribosyltransferase [Bacillus cereus]MCU5022356.1 ADP-ribosyltransferase [Bacillus cereus]MCU5643396.1 ADP-ribosyltransferase [Bacillus cereus]MCU5743974.1 ADP-ribosyltransferase [Bacillus cereus]MCU9576597.1 ADP-ribosyltransferase [Bacillus cereus]
MDVKYRPEPWQNMGDGMNRITKDALMKLREANESLKRIDGRIRDLDSDGSIHFNPKDQSQKIGELLDSYTTLQKYCGEAGRLVSEHIDKPFLVEMDKFAQKMRDTSILSFETNNRIGSTTTTVLPGAHAGYGSVPQTIQKKKDKITVEDIFKDSPAFDNVLRAEYEELKKQNPDAKLNYEEYKKVVPSTRGFEYKSIEDEQKKLEMVRDIGIGVGIIITTILCPPLGAAAAVVYGAVQIKSGIDGEDWGTHRKLSQEERVGNIIFGGLDAIPVVGAVGKGVKAFKGTSELADLAKLLKFKEGMPGFNPNLGKNVVQSLKENNLLKNLKIQGWKTVGKINDADYFIKGLVAKGVDSVTPFAKGVEILPDGSVARTGTNYSGKFQEAHDASKASIQSRISNLESGGVKGTGKVGYGSNISDNISKEIKELDKEINRLKIEGNDKEVKRLTREKNKLANKLDTKDVISDHYDLKVAKEYERKIDNSKYFSHDKGDFGEEVTKIVARDSDLGKDVSDLFQVGRNGIDAAFLSKGPPPKLTIIESKASDSASFSYSDKQKKGGDTYFQDMVNSDDPRYANFRDNLENLMEESPDLQFDFIRVETDIKITDTGFGVDELKVKDWNKKID